MKNLQMKSLLPCLLVCVLISACQPSATTSLPLENWANFFARKVVYGQDDRLDPEDQQHPMLQELARSSVAQIKEEHLITAEDDNYFKLNGPTLADKGICPGEKFAQQLAVARCSGFLVAPNLVATAGHCISNTRGLAGHYWVFDYQQDLITGQGGLIPKENVYLGKKIVARSIDPKKGIDFALIELDREVMDRSPLAFRQLGTIDDQAELAIIGHPSGLPTKIAIGGSIRTNRDPSLFVASLDSFGGNSGSPVINLVSFEVEGILVRGEVDYEMQGNCQVVKICLPQACRGEDVVRITSIPGLQNI